MSDELSHLGGRVERRFLHALDSSGGVIQKRADVMLGRASRTVRRGSFVLALGWLGLVFFTAAWVMFNLAMHGWVTARWSVVTAHFVVTGINLLGGGVLMLSAAVLAPTVERAHKRPRRTAAQQTLLAAQAQAKAEARPPADSIEAALGSAIELGLLAAQTIPQLIRAFRKPPSQPESPTTE